MRSSPKSRPVTPAELSELRDLTREMKGLLKAARDLGPYIPAAKAARLLGFESTRPLLDLVREGAFPGAWKPAENRVHLPLSEVRAYIEARRVQVPTLEGCAR